MKLITVDCIDQSEEGIWGISNEWRILFRYEALTGELKIIRKLPDFIINATKSIKIVDKKIFLFPYWNEKLFVYLIEKDDWLSIEIAETINENLYTNYIGTINHVLYMYVLANGIIVGLDVDTYKITQFKVPEKYLGRVSVTGSTCADGTFIFPITDSNSFLAFDADKEILSICTINEFSEGIITSAYDGRHCWFTGKDKRLIKWDIQQNKIVSEWYLPDDLMMYNSAENIWVSCSEMKSGTVYPFTQSIIIDGKLWLFPFQSNIILQVDINTGKQQTITFSDYGLPKNEDICRYIGQYDDRLVIRDFRRDMYYIEPLKAELKKLCVILPEEYMAEHFKNPVWESQGINFGDLISLIMPDKAGCVNNSRLSGENILRTIKE